MFSIQESDLLAALKKYRRLAKQDLLLSSQTPDPEFWRIHTEARRAQYQFLIDHIQSEGIESAYKRCVSIYMSLPLESEDFRDPVVLGKEQALEVLFLTLGINPMTRIRLRNARKHVRRVSSTDKAKGLTRPRFYDQYET